MPGVPLSVERFNVAGAILTKRAFFLILTLLAALVTAMAYGLGGSFASA